MTNAVQLSQNLPTTPALPNPILIRSMDILLSGSYREGSKVKLLPGKGLSETERGALQARLSNLSRSIDYRDNREIGRVIAQMLATFPSARAGSDDARMVIAAYVEMLSDLPPWSVIDACRQWATGRAGSDAPAFPPSASQLHESAARNIQRFAFERSRIMDSLAAKECPVSEEERARVAAGFDALTNSFAGRREAIQKASVTSARSALEDRCDEMGIDRSAIDELKDAPPRLGSWQKARTA